MTTPLILAPFLFLACASAPSPSPEVKEPEVREGGRALRRDVSLGDYLLGTGDIVKITVYGQKNLSDKYRVDSSGHVSFPLIGQVVAEGVTVDSLRRTITNKLRQGYLKNPSVTIEVLNFRPFYILGEVNRPGSYPYIDGISIWNAVALAGGFSSRADKGDIVIQRKTDGGVKKIKATLDTIVLPGDIIEVTQRFF